MSISSFITYILSFLRKKYPTGVLQDPRDAADKLCDYLHEERLPVKVDDPFSNQKIVESPYLYENQAGTFSCVPHGVGLALAIERKTDNGVYARLSWLFGYRLRSNYPSEGSWFQDIFNIYRKWGAPLYSSLPTAPNMTEAQANSVVCTAQMYTEAELYRGNEYYMFESPNDFEEIARVAQRGHAVPILIYSRLGEWSRQYPIIESALELFGAPVRHCVCILPYSGFTEGGTRFVVAQDSAWFGGIKLRYLSEAFIKSRCYAAGYWDTVKTLPTGAYPKYTFTKVLKYGSSGPEVTAMQKLFIAEGLLPDDLASGYFAGRTLAALHAFQNKYANEILVPLSLEYPTDIWGSASIAKANKLCSS